MLLASLVLRAASARAGGVRPERSVLFHTEQQPAWVSVASGALVEKVLLV